MKSANQYLPAILLLALSIFCLTPQLTRADQQPPLGKITIDVAGQATAIGSSGASGATSLNLTAKAYKNSNQWLIIQNITGALQISSTKFTITGGQGSVSSVGATAIFADTPTKQGQLILHGTLNGNSITFGTPSQLLSTSYLNLSGNFNGLENIPSNSETTGPSPSITTPTENTVQNATTSRTQNQHANSTSTISGSVQQNTTIHTANTTLTTSTTSASTSTTATFATSSNLTIQNGTSSNNGAKQHSLSVHVVQGQGEICLSSRDEMPSCTSTTQTVTVNDGELVNIDSTPSDGFIWDHYDGLGNGQGQNFNTMITQDNTIGAYFKPTSTSSSSVTAAISLPTSNISMTTSSTGISAAATVANTTPQIPGSITVTATQYLNQTVSVTHTVAYHTVSYTVTSTVAATTITRSNVTSTINETTTVSTTTGP